MRESLIQKRSFKIVYSIIAIAAFAAIALVIMFFVSRNGLYPSGPDAMYHVYRGEFLYDSIGSGNWYPLYDPNWYNGVEIMRYISPMCPYFYAFCIEIASYIYVQYFGGYILYVGLLFFFEALVWFVIGMRLKRPFVGTAMAVLWFFMPNNLYTLFGEGDLARAMCMIFLPIFIYAVYGYLNTAKLRFLPITTVSIMFMALCDVGYAGMMAIALVVYLIMDMWSFRRYLYDLRIIISTALGFAITGLWAVPGLVGGLSRSSGSDLSKSFQNLLISINPFFRVSNGLEKTVYFGLALAILALLGSFLSYRRSRPGFLLGLIVLILSTDTMYNVVRLLPGNTFLGMLKYISIALCFIFMSFMMWNTLKKPIMVAILVLIALDAIPSLGFISGEANDIWPEERLSTFGEEMLLNKAKSLTKQRLCIIDEGELSTEGAYIPAAGEKGVKITTGAHWETAETGTNISYLNRGMENQGYYYSFDRALELGSDTVLIYIMGDEADHFVEMDSAARRVGYSYVDQSGPCRLYKLTKDHPNEWGVVTEYKAVVIGKGSDNISRQFPYVKEGGSDLLDDYTFEELSKYEMIYLAAFEFMDRSYAEDLVLRLSQAGTRVIISADGVPEDRAVNGRVFLGVVSNPISFSQGFPLLETIEGTLDTDLFPSDSREWGTFFCDGLDEVWGKVKDENYDIPFLGTVKNDNIIFVGLNLTFYYGETKDEGVEKLLARIMDITPDRLPERTIVPLKIEYGPGRITITSKYDNVDTTLAYHKIFASDDPIYADNHLLYVSKGVTDIYLTYPMLAPGLICTLLAIILAVMYHWMIHLREVKKRSAEEEEKMKAEIDQNKHNRRLTDEQIKKVRRENWAGDLPRKPKKKKRQKKVDAAGRTEPGTRPKKSNTTGWPEPKKSPIKKKGVK